MEEYLNYLRTQSFVSLLSLSPYFIRYLPLPVDGVVLSGQDGILTRKDTEILCNELLRTAGDKEALIERINQEIDKTVQESRCPSTKNKKSDLSGFVYLIKADTGHYKIGYSKRPFDRLKTFAVKLPFEVELIHQIESDDMYQAENELHNRFADRRVNGEWFSLTQEDIDSILSIKKL